jgi:hypothetical protein
MRAPYTFLNFDAFMRARFSLRQEKSIEELFQKTRSFSGGIAFLLSQSGLTLLPQGDALQGPNRIPAFKLHRVVGISSLTWENLY